MRYQKNVVLFLIAIGATMSVRADAFDWFGKDKNEKPVVAAPQKSVVSQKPEPKKVEAPKAGNAKAAAVPAAGDLQSLNRNALNNRMANNKTMTDAEKSQLSEAALKYFPAGADLTSKDFEKDTLSFEQIVNDPNMKVSEKQAALETYFSGPRDTTPAEPSVTQVKPGFEAMHKAAEMPAESKKTAPVPAAFETTAVSEEPVEVTAPKVVESQPVVKVETEETKPESPPASTAAKDQQPVKVKKHSNNFA